MNRSLVLYGIPYTENHTGYKTHNKLVGNIWVLQEIGKRLPVNLRELGIDEEQVVLKYVFDFENDDIEKFLETELEFVRGINYVPCAPEERDIYVEVVLEVIHEYKRDYLNGEDSRILKEINRSIRGL